MEFDSRIALEMGRGGNRLATGGLRGAGVGRSRVLVLLAILAGGITVPAQTLDEVVRRACRAVEHNEVRLAEMVAREKYSQRVRDWQSKSTEVRVLESEMLLVRPTDCDGWEVFRDVLVVDGKPVKDRPVRLQKLFLDNPDTLEKIRLESVRYNLGPVFRDFNNPLAAVYVLYPENRGRFSFQKAGEADLEGAPVWILKFEERERPTLFRFNGREFFVYGELWVSPADGCVRKTRLVINPSSGEPGTGPPGNRAGTAGEALEKPLMEAEIETVYRMDAGSGILAPVHLTEIYRLYGAFRRPHSTIWGEAWYSDFRIHTVETNMDDAVTKILR
ncbi:MAG: hypothetical protein KA419_15785 [Acidobacteria bacterium]|nr:hypothetical protein [Acidobacteriota bacterium]